MESLSDDPKSVTEQEYIKQEGSKKPTQSGSLGRLGGC